MSDDLLSGTAIAMAEAVAAGDIGAVELLDLHLERVDAVNPALNAVIWEDREQARAVAAELDAETAAGKSRGPLHGVPMTVKEAFDLLGAPSTWGSPALANNRPKLDSDVVARYRAAGAVIFGKTNVPLNLADWQTFNDVYGTTNNPWDPTRVPGGSSGGSAVALATGMAALEAGSDIGSSIRNPAHYCGVFGLKPTWGVVPLKGHSPPGFTGDVDIAVTGPMTRSAVDLELAFDVLQGATWPVDGAWTTTDTLDGRTRLADFKVAVKLDDRACPVDQAYQDQLRSLADDLAAAGATVSFDAEPDIDRAKYFDLYITLLGAAMSFGATKEANEIDRALLGTLTDSRAHHLFSTRLDGREMGHADWLLADEERRTARRIFDSFFADWDILLAPACASAAFPHDQSGARIERFITVNSGPQPEMLQLFWSGYSGVIGLPSVVGPAGFVDGLPVGYQAIAGYGRDRTALAFAKAIERERGGFAPPEPIS